MRIGGVGQFIPTEQARDEPAHAHDRERETGPGRGGLDAGPEYVVATVHRFVFVVYCVRFDLEESECPRAANFRAGGGLSAAHQFFMDQRKRLHGDRAGLGAERGPVPLHGEGLFEIPVGAR